MESRIELLELVEGNRGEVGDESEEWGIQAGVRIKGWRAPKFARGAVMEVGVAVWVVWGGRLGAAANRVQC